MEKNIEIEETGLKCDNPNCDWENESVKMEDYKEWLNKPCPKCGQNVLTEEDYNNAQMLHLMAEFINDCSEEELGELAEIANENKDAIMEHPVFKDMEGKELLDDSHSDFDPEKKVSISFSTHKEIKAVKVEKEKE